MLDINTAKMHLKSTFDSAFSKSIGTKKQRIAMANQCLRMVPCNDPVPLMLWATNYCANWTADCK